MTSPQRPPGRNAAIIKAGPVAAEWSGRGGSFRTYIKRHPDHRKEMSPQLHQEFKKDWLHANPFLFEGERTRAERACPEYFPDSSLTEAVFCVAKYIVTVGIIGNILTERMTVAAAAIFTVAIISFVIGFYTIPPKKEGS